MSRIYFEMSDLNQFLVRREPKKVEGMLNAANWFNEQSDMRRNGYPAGNLMLLKFNLINKRQCRRGYKKPVPQQS